MHIVVPAIAALVAIAMLAPVSWADTHVPVEVNVQVLDNSVLVQVLNVTETVSDFVVWFVSDTVIESSVVQHGWNAAQTDSAVRITDDIGPGQTLQLGIKFEGSDPKMAWAATVGSENRTGWLWGQNDTRTDHIRINNETGDNVERQPVSEISTNGILQNSEFRIVPDKPSAGSTIRLIGTGFGQSQSLELQVGGHSLESVMTDDAGSFVATRTLPDTLQDRVSFVLTDLQGNRIDISIRLTDQTVIRDSQEAFEPSLSVTKDVYSRGEYLELTLSAEPLSTMTVSLVDPAGLRITSKAVVIPQDGTWESGRDIIVPLDASDGPYIVQASDGAQTVTANITVELDKSIVVNPTRTIFDPGDPIRFVGTAKPGMDISLILFDPNDDEITMDSIPVGEDGQVEWEYPTGHNFRKGTYTLVLTQGEEQEFVYAGLGEAIEIPIRIVFDKIFYLPSEVPKVNIASETGGEVMLLVADPTDNVVLSETITIQQDGRATYRMDLAGYASGIYTAVVQKGTIQADFRFGVGLRTSVANIDMNTKSQYVPGEAVLLLGMTDVNAILTISLIDPDGQTVQTINTFSDRTGAVTEKRLRIPHDAQEGVWTIKTASGPNSDVDYVTVGSADPAGLAITVENTSDGTFIVITGATRNYVTLSISDGTYEIESDLRAYVTRDGTGRLPWTVDATGAYTITAEDGNRTVQTLYLHTAQ